MTENAGCETNGRSKSQGMNLQDMKMFDFNFLLYVSAKK